MARHRHTAVTAVIAVTGVALAMLGTAGSAGAAQATGPAPARHPAARRGLTPPAAPASAAGRYVVRVDAARPGSAGRLAGALAAAGGRLVARQASLGTEVVELPARAAALLSRVPGVIAVVPDQELRTASLGFAPSSQPGSLTNVTRLTGAQSLWKAGWTGAGVDVALIDSGVAPVPALADPKKVFVGPDLSFESQDPAHRYVDTYGHGTHMGGIIAGRETGKQSGSQSAADTANFYGMAPDARLVELKVADHDGAVDVSQVIAAIDWVVQNKATNGLNIRVLNLSFGTLSPQSPAADPLSWAAEVAWKAGIVVVASAGNEGATTAGIANPAYNPFVLAIGAADTKGTDTTTDDTVPAFSAKQGGNWGSRSIDVVAPGVGIVAPAVPGSAARGAGFGPPAVPGSAISTSYPGAAMGNGFIRGSGTSQASAVVSGGVAL